MAERPTPKERGDCDCAENEGAICPECFAYYRQDDPR